MRDKAFSEWLEGKYPNPNSWRTYRSEARRMFKYIGDFDEIYENDQFSTLLETFYHSKNGGIEPNDDIPHRADPYKTADFRKRCIELYIEFYEENPRRKKV